MRVLLLFLDGVGIGKKNSTVNPFFAAKLPNIQSILGGDLPHRGRKSFKGNVADCIPVNATLGVSGLPQSGTGQTAIFTGVNGPKVFGRHFGPFPPSSLRPIIEGRNIFRRLKDLKKTVSFANAFPQRFFDYTNSGTRRLTVTTLSCMMAGVPLRTAESLKKNEAVSAELTREKWSDLGHRDVNPISAEEAGRHFWGIAEQYDFTLFEYWLTDHAGHSQKMEFGVETLEKFDQFLGGVLSRFDFENSLLVMISDHGNLEDLSTKSHTRNQVPCIAIGKKRRQFLSNVKNLTHISPAILSILLDHE
ncbi:MAG: metalloenzyme [Ignavibacteriales bacterium]|nr:metalloenzyme [Ignavibacteriales bacterium]